MADHVKIISDEITRMVIGQVRASVKKNNQKLAENSLKRMCILSLLKHKSLVCKLATRIQTNPMEALKKELRSEVMQAISNLHQKQDAEGAELLQTCMLLGLLVHNEVTTFELPRCDLGVRSNNLAFERLWQKVAESASGSLRRLTSICIMDSETPFVRFFLNNVSTFSNLQELDFRRFKCNDEMFELVAQHLPQLTYLRVLVDKKNVPELGFQALSRLPNLRVLLLTDFDRDRNTELSQVLRCIQLMPRLQVVGREFNIDQFLFGFHFFGFHNQLQQLKRPVRLGLHDLVLSGEGVRLPKDCQVPDVRRLHLYKPAAEVRPLVLRLSQVTELGLWKVDNDVVNEVLPVLGSRLDKLSLQTTEPLHLGRVFRFCPQLSELRVVQSNVVNFCNPLPPSAAFSRLRLLSISLDFCGLGQLPSGMLPLMLRAPLLEMVRIADIWLNPDEVQLLLRLLKDRAILQRLKTFVCKANNQYLSQQLQQQVEEFCPLVRQTGLDNYAEFVRNLVL